MIQFVCLSIHRSLSSFSLCRQGQALVNGHYHWPASSSGQEPAGAGCALLCGSELCIKRRLFMMYKSLLLTSVNENNYLPSKEKIFKQPRLPQAVCCICNRPRLFMVSYMESSRHIKQSIFSVDAAQLNRFRGNVGLIPNCRLWLIPKKGISHVTYCAIFPFQSGAK